MNNTSYHKHIHKNSSLETLIDFVTDGASIGNGLDVIELVNFEDEYGVKNFERILRLYENNISSYSSIRDNLTESNRSIIESLPLQIGIELILPLSKINRELRKFDTNQVVDFRSFNQFIASQLYALLKEPKYERTYKIKGKSPINTIRDIFPFLSVWLWSRTLSVDEDGNYNDTIIDITPFITNLDTNSSPDGGDFSLSIAPVSAEYIQNQGWSIDPNMKVSGDSFISDNGLYKSREGDLKRSDLYFHNIIQENDVIFIRFEKLDLEEDREQKKNKKDFRIDKSELAGKIYDMIGLVDVNTVSTEGGSSNVSINVGGRDLVKLFIEDGVYFYPYDFISGGGGIFANENIGDRLERYDGQLKSRFQFGFKTIDNTLKFILNALSTIKITSDDLFDSYKDSLDIGDLIYRDRRSKKYFVKQTQLLERQQEVEDQDLEVTEIKRLIEKSIGEEKIKTNFNSNVIYNKIVEFLKKDKSKILETENNLIGWDKGIIIDGENLKKNDLPLFFSGKLFENKRLWRDHRGNIISDTERIAFLNKVKKEQENIQTKIDNALMGRNLDVDNKQKVKDAKKDEPFPDAWNEYQAAYFNDQEPIQDNTILKNSQGEVVNPRLEEQKMKFNLLSAEYDKLTAQGKKIHAVLLPKRFDELNEFAQEVFKRTWSLIKRIETYQNQSIKDELKDTKGIWQIIKLVIDDNIRNRRIVDSSIGNEHGSLINALRKIAQEPFVELIFDTYGDQYYITVRKPPFDKIGMTSILEDQNILTDKLSNNLSNTGPNPGEEDNEYKKQSTIIDIEEYDILSDSLNYGVTNQIYSWYRLTPQNLIGGQASDMAFAYLKAIYLKEYADIWGSKPLDISTNYIPYFPVVDKNSKLPTGYFLKQGILDLKYMIESNAYNPFVRQGTITVVGNRLYKKGTFVRLKSTNEIFYVNNVSNSYSQTDRVITRTTTLQLSRGMVEDYIKGQEYNGVNYSYFNIVDTEIDDNKFLCQDQGYDDFNKLLANWKVNTEVFNFFLNKKQFAHKANFIDIPKGAGLGLNT